MTSEPLILKASLDVAAESFGDLTTIPRNADAKASHYTFSSIVLGVARSVPFQMKEVAPPAAPGPTSEPQSEARISR